MILLVVSMVSLVQSIDRREVAMRLSSTTSGSAGIAEVAIVPKVEFFEVRLSRDDDPSATERLIGVSAVQASCGDSMRVTAQLDAPGYAYLLSLTADGSISVVDPPSPNLVPERTELIAYPRFPRQFARLSQGPGLQGLLLLVSAEPLPAYADWAPGRQLRWPSTQAIGAWRSNGRGLERWEPGVPIASDGVVDPPKTVARMYRAMQRLEGLDARELIAFPVRLSTD
jgi:hypothetical protein